MNRRIFPRTKSEYSQQWQRPALLAACTIAACFFIIASSFGQSVTTGSHNQSVTLEPPTGWDLQENAFDGQGNPLPELPPNYRRLGTVTAGEVGPLHTLTLRFAASVALNQIESTKDFEIERGGSCVVGDAYPANGTCTLLVRFTPQGPGHRLGFLKITNSGEPTPSFVGLTGNGYAPVISFIPAQIATVPATVSAGVGTIKSATNMTIDGGDILYIPDSGANLIKQIDSSGNINTVSPVFATPATLAVDSSGVLYSTNVSGSTYYFSAYYPWGVQSAFGYTYAPGTCTPSTPCPFSTVGMSQPASLSIDPYDNLFFDERTKGAAEMPVASIAGGSGSFNLWYLKNQFTYTSGTPTSYAVDASDNLYNFYNFSTTVCYLQEDPLYYAENTPTAKRVAGGAACGFSGDGGQARSAEISAKVGQITFDVAGDLYFADAGNQRIRRIDAATGIIRTIAGNGTAGYTGDGNKATSAELSAPTGVAVSSQGIVYIISSATTGQIVRKVGPNGYLSFGSQTKGVASAAQIVTVTNTGNTTMTLANVSITGANPSEFKIDNTMTTCVLTTGSALAAGQSCHIGVILTPAGTGTRRATMTLLDNTVDGSDNVIMAGTGVLPSSKLTITAPTSGATFASGTAVPFSVSVTSASGPQPTGTVQFQVDGANYGSPVTVSSTGKASTSVTGLTIANHKLTASYSGSSNYAAASPLSVTITVKTATSVEFASPTASQVVASAASFPIKVTVTSKTSPAPTGSVTFSVDGKQVGSAVKIASGAASTTVSSLAAGAHAIRAAYSGDTEHQATNSNETITVK